MGYIKHSRTKKQYREVPIFLRIPLASSPFLPQYELPNNIQMARKQLLGKLKWWHEESCRFPPPPPLP